MSLTAIGSVTRAPAGTNCAGFCMSFADGSPDDVQHAVARDDVHDAGRTAESTTAAPTRRLPRAELPARAGAAPVVPLAAAGAPGGGAPAGGAAGEHPALLPAPASAPRRDRHLGAAPPRPAPAGTGAPSPGLPTAARVASAPATRAGTATRRRGAGTEQAPAALPRPARGACAPRSRSRAERLVPERRAGVVVDRDHVVACR